MSEEVVEQMKAVAKLMDMTDRFHPKCVVAVVGPEATAARKAFHRLWNALVKEPRNGAKVEMP